MGRAPQRSAASLLAAMMLMAASAFAANAPHVNIVALGSSTTAGRGVGESAAYPTQLEALLRAKGFDVSVANAGISGDTSAGIHDVKRPHSTSFEVTGTL